MDLPCTQLLLDDFDETGLSETSEKLQVGSLIVQENQKLGIEETEYSIFEGDNIIGRHENCDISIPLGVALSKKHACIEADKSTCYIYDCGSSNKTKLGSLKLKPEIRYCLLDGNIIVFANVKCTYKQINSLPSQHSKVTSSESPVSTFESADCSRPIQNEVDDILNDADSDMFVPDSQPENQSENSKVTNGKKKVLTEVAVEKDVGNGNACDESTTEYKYDENNNEGSDSDTDLEEMVSISKASDAAKGGDSDATDVDAEFYGIDTIAETPRNSFVVDSRKSSFIESTDHKDGERGLVSKETFHQDDSDSNDDYSLLTAIRTQAFSSQAQHETNKGIIAAVMEQKNAESHIDSSTTVMPQECANVVSGQKSNELDVEFHRDSMNKIVSSTGQITRPEKYPLDLEQKLAARDISPFRDATNQPDKIKLNCTDDNLVLPPQSSSPDTLCQPEEIVSTATLNVIDEDKKSVKPNLAASAEFKDRPDVNMTKATDNAQTLAPEQNLLLVNSSSNSTTSLLEITDAALTRDNTPIDIVTDDSPLYGNHKLDDSESTPIKICGSAMNDELKDVAPASNTCSGSKQKSEIDNFSKTEASTLGIHEGFTNARFEDDLLESSKVSTTCCVNSTDMGDRIEMSNSKCDKFQDARTATVKVNGINLPENSLLDKKSNENQQPPNDVQEASYTVAFASNNVKTNALSTDLSNNSSANEQGINSLTDALKLSDTMMKKSIVVAKDFNEKPVAQSSSGAVAGATERVSSDHATDNEEEQVAENNAMIQKQAICESNDLKDQSLSSLLPVINPSSNLSIYNLVLPDSYISDGESDEDIFHSTPTSDVENEPYACAETQPFCDAGAASLVHPPLPSISKVESTSTPLKSFSKLFTPVKERRVPSSFITPSSILSARQCAPKTPELDASAERATLNTSKVSPTSKSALPATPDSNIANPSRPKRKGRGQNNKFDNNMYECTVPKRRKFSNEKKKKIENCFQSSQINKTLTDDCVENDKLCPASTEQVDQDVCIDSRKASEDVDRHQINNADADQNKHVVCRKSARRKVGESVEQSSSTNQKTKARSRKHAEKTVFAISDGESALQNEVSIVLKPTSDDDNAAIFALKPSSIRHDAEPCVENIRNNSDDRNKNCTSSSTTAHKNVLRKSKRIAQTLAKSTSRICKKDDAKELSPPSPKSKSLIPDKDASEILPGKFSPKRICARRTRTHSSADDSIGSTGDETSTVSEWKKRKTKKSVTCATNKYDKNDMDVDDGLVHSASLALRPRKLKPKVMFTGVIDKLGKSIVKDLGGHLTDDLLECTHLVTDKMRRTVKFLCAVVRGIYIVNQSWLRKSKEFKRFLSEDEFGLSDDLLSQPNAPNTSPSTSLEVQYGFKLSESLAIAKSRTQALFDGYRIHVTKSVLPPPEQMYQIIECGGGKKVIKLPKGNKLKDLVIVSAEEDEKLCSAAVKANIPIYDKEFILTGILRQKLELQKNRLFQQPSSSPQSKKSSMVTRNKSDSTEASITSSCRTTRSIDRKRTQ